jgi:hypothetical protein
MHMTLLRSLLTYVRYSGEGNISSHPDIDADFGRCLQEMTDYISYLRACRTCALYDVMFCDEFTHVNDLMQLGCHHYFHKACISGFLRTEIEKYRANASEIQMVCYECKESQNICDCESCTERMDRGENFGHIYTEQEVNALVGPGGLSEQDKANWDKYSNIK